MTKIKHWNKSIFPTNAPNEIHTHTDDFNADINDNYEIVSITSHKLKNIFFQKREINIYH